MLRPPKLATLLILRGCPAPPMLFSVKSALLVPLRVPSQLKLDHALAVSGARVSVPVVETPRVALEPSQL